MSHEISYKLGRYKIVESPGGGLWWESHFGFGSAQTGRCFVDGNILIIGARDGEKSGYLKREFMEHLVKLPPWEKTKYYCLSHALHKCNAKVREEFDGGLSRKIGNSGNFALNKPSRTKAHVMQTGNKQPYARRNIISLKRRIMGIENRIRSFMGTFASCCFKVYHSKIKG